MIAILAIEQLTRTARPAATVIVPAGTSTTITSPSEFAVELRRAATATENARIRSERIEEDAKTNNCSAITKPADDASADDKAKWTRCEGLKAELATASEDLRRAEAAQTALGDAAAKNRGGQGTTASRTEQPERGNTPPVEQVRTDLQAVALSVERIVMAAFDTDETQLFCLQTLAPDPAALPGTETARMDLQNKCLTYLMQRVEAETRRLGLSGNFNSDQEHLLAYVGKDDDAAAVDRWQKLLARSGVLTSDEVVQPVKERLSSAVSIQQIRSAFAGAGPSAQRILAPFLQPYR